MLHRAATADPEMRTRGLHPLIALAQDRFGLRHIKARLAPHDAGIDQLAMQGITHEHDLAVVAGDGIGAQIERIWA